LSKRRLLSVLLTLFLFLLLAYGIVSIELTIWWNELAGLSGISSTGQLIPFIVGVFSMFRALVLLFF